MQAIIEGQADRNYGQPENNAQQRLSHDNQLEVGQGTAIGTYRAPRHHLLRVGRTKQVGAV